MGDCRYLPENFEASDAVDWVAECARKSGWTGHEAERLAHCVGESAMSVSKRAYQLHDRGPVFLKLDIDATEAVLELHHEGSIGDKPCDCAAARTASHRKSTVWLDGQLRTHRLRIARG